MLHFEGDGKLSCSYIFLELMLCPTMQSSGQEVPLLIGSRTWVVAGPYIRTYSKYVGMGISYLPSYT